MIQRLTMMKTKHLPLPPPTSLLQKKSPRHQAKRTSEPWTVYRPSPPSQPRLHDGRPPILKKRGLERTEYHLHSHSCISCSTSRFAYSNPPKSAREHSYCRHRALHET